MDNLKWVKLQERWLRVSYPSLPPQDECEPMRATWEGSADDVFVNLRSFFPLATAEDGTMLCRRVLEAGASDVSLTAGGHPATQYALVKAPCGKVHEESLPNDCGCGCNGGAWRIVLLTLSRAAVWLHEHGFDMRCADPAVREAWDRMLIE